MRGMTLSPLAIQLGIAAILGPILAFSLMNIIVYSALAIVVLRLLRSQRAGR